MKTILILALIAFTAYGYTCRGLITYTTNRDYSTGEVVTFDGAAYRYIGAWPSCQPLSDASFWTPLGDCEDDPSPAALVWNSVDQFYKGQIVDLDGVLYVANSDNKCANPCDPNTDWFTNPWQLVGTRFIDCDNAIRYEDVYQNPGFHFRANDIVRQGDTLYIVRHWTSDAPEDASGPWEAYKRLFDCTSSDCPNFLGCANTDYFSFSVHYARCDCTKVQFKSDFDASFTDIIFCTNADSFCQSPENYFNWEFYTVCGGGSTCAGVASYNGSEVPRGTVLQHQGNLYVAKWTTNAVPGTTDPQWGDYRWLRAC